MNQAIAVQWVAALRSGKYDQKQGQLRGECLTSFCCLGVLCDLHAQAYPHDNEKQWDLSKYMDMDDVLPEIVMKWAELRCNDGYLPNGSLHISGYSSLAEANDAGIKFPEIADFIEKNYETL